MQTGFSGFSGQPAVGITYYYSNSAADIGGVWTYFDKAPDNDPETYYTVTLTNSAANIADFITVTG